MRTLKGVVEDGIIKVPNPSGLAEGATVTVALIEEADLSGPNPIPAGIEAEDVEFVRACRGRLVRHLSENE